MSHARRGHMRMLPKAWHLFGSPDPDGNLNVVKKSSLRRLRREQHAREREQSPADVSTLQAADAKRERRRERNQEAAR